MEIRQDDVVYTYILLHLAEKMRERKLWVGNGKGWRETGGSVGQKCVQKQFNLNNSVKYELTLTIYELDLYFGL